MKRILLIILSLLVLTGCETDVTPPLEEEQETELVTVDPMEMTLIPNRLLTEAGLKWGYVDLNDRETFIVPAMYELVMPIDLNGNGIVKTSDGTGIINKKNQWQLMPGKYESITSFDHYYIASLSTDRTMLLNAQMKVIAQGIGYHGIEIINDRLFVTTESDVFVLETATGQLNKLEADVSDEKLALEKMFYQSLILYEQDADGEYYYIDDGIVLSRNYDTITAFKDGYAVVGEVFENEDSYMTSYRYGLIDTSGHEVLPMEYLYLEPLGDNYYAFTSMASMDQPDYFIIPFSDHAFKKGIMKAGDVLMQEEFYSINYVGEDIFQVDDGIGFRFIESDGNEVYTHVPLESSYHFINDGVVIKGENDQNTVFFNDDYYVADNIHQFIPHGYVEHVIKGRADIEVRYPKLHLEQARVAEEINQTIKEQFPLESYSENGVYYESSDADYALQVDHQILVIDGSYYFYGFGAAHGNYYEQTMHFSLDTGELLTLDMLIDGDVKQVVSQWLADYSYQEPYFYEDMESLTREERVAYFERDQYEFRVLDGQLSIYFNPYDVGPYAAGIITFTWPLDELEEVNTNSLFMNMSE